MSEQFGVDSAFGYGSAVYSYIFTMLAGAVEMDYLREEFLTRTALARHEHRQVNRSHAYGTLNGIVERRRIAHDAEALLHGHYLRGYFRLV